MQPKLVRHIILSILACLSLVAFSQDTSLARLKVNVTDTFFGVPVADPYRWLESMNSDTTKNWLKFQEKISRAERTKFAAQYMAINIKMDEMGTTWNYAYEKQGPYYFKTYFQSINSSPVLFYKKTPDDVGAVAYDPNNFSNEKVTIADYALSPDAQNLAVMLSKAGSDWCQIVVHNLNSGKDMSEKVDWVKFSNIVWYKNGFFYSRFKVPADGLLHVESNTNQQLCYHKLGTSQQSDEIIYSVPDKANAIFDFESTSNQKYLIIYSVAKLRGKWQNIVVYKDLQQGIFAETQLLIASTGDDDADYDVIDFIGDKFIVQTNLNAPHYRVLAYHKDSLNYADLLVQEYKEILRSVHHVGNKIYCQYFNQGVYEGVIFTEEGEALHRFKYPEGVSITPLAGAPYDTLLYFYQNSFYSPRALYSLNLNTAKAEVINKTQVQYDVSTFNSAIVTCKSKDGTDIPMYITYKKGLNLKNNNPVLLYGYGGYGISVDPFFSFSNIILFENSGILAVPLIRGGGEFGKDWHEQGKLLNKQNSFDDFIAAAEFLIANGYTSKEKLAIKGASNGGLLVGAVLTQRPELFKVAIGEVGAYDMLRYHLFTGGRFLQNEYGSSTDSTEFFNLKKYSPLHNIKKGTNYPATLLITSENDDRVPPLHSYKFLATLQEKSSGTNPHILYFEDDAGHNRALTLNNYFNQQAFELAFIFKQMNLKVATYF